MTLSFLLYFPFLSVDIPVDSHYLRELNHCIEWGPFRTQIIWFSWLLSNYLVFGWSLRQCVFSKLQDQSWGKNNHSALGIVFSLPSFILHLDLAHSLGCINEDCISNTSQYLLDVIEVVPSSAILVFMPLLFPLTYASSCSVWLLHESDCKLASKSL